MNTKSRLAVVILIMMTFLTACNFGADRNTRDVLQEAINELSRQPGRWQEVLTSLTNELGDEARSTIQALSSEMNSFMQNVGIEGRCNIDFVGQRVLGALRQILNNGSYRLSPWICHTTPSSFKIRRNGLSETSIIGVTGFGFTSSSVRDTQIRIANRNGNRIRNLSMLPDRESNYRMNLNLQGISFPANTSDAGNKLEIRWPDEEWISVSILLPAIVEDPPPANVKLKVTFQYIDVFLDGSWGADKWSIFFSLNGERGMTIWDRRRDISDDCQEEAGYRGPGGDKDFCRYNLLGISSADRVITIPRNKSLTVSFWGTAHDDNDQVERRTVTFRPNENWGISRNNHRLGARYRGDTEYWVYFKIEEVPVP